MQNKFSHKRSKRLGFTLLELMIVVSLLAVLTAMVTPVFSGTFRGIEAENEARNLVSFMEYAQNRAVTDAKEYRVFLVPEAGLYWMEKAEGRGGAAVEFVMVDEAEVDEVRLPELVQLVLPRARQYMGKQIHYVSFYPNGMCDDAMVAMQNVDDETVFVITTSGSHVRWMDGEV